MHKIWVKYEVQKQNMKEKETKNKEQEDKAQCYFNMLITFHDLAIKLMLIHVSTQQSQTVQMTKLHFYNTKQNAQK